MSRLSCTQSITRIALVAGVIASAGLALPAMADCDAKGNPLTAGTKCYNLKGSDTLFDIMTTAITNARAAGVPGATNLFYAGTGSGNAENQLKQVAGTNTLTNADLGVQSIGPMSRNMRPATIDPLATVTGAFTGKFTQRDLGTNIAAQGHASWAPTCQNVVGLDAAAFITRATGNGNGLNDVGFPTQNNTFAAPAQFPQAKVNVNLPLAFNDGSAFGNAAATVNYSNTWSIIMSGVDGSGSLQACSDPRRVRALLDLATALGITGTIDHFYRRDDNSGTTDSIKDRIIVVNSPTIAGVTNLDPRYPFTGGRFCNGQSIGNINGAVAQTGICSVTRSKNTCLVSNDCPAGETCLFNLNNQDLDPIRRPCAVADATKWPTTCTDMTTGKMCHPTAASVCSVNSAIACTVNADCPVAPAQTCVTNAWAANCTQGLVVPITDFDPGSTDQTTSIANRIKNGGGTIIGYAGREAASGAVYSTKMVKINGVKGSDFNVRNSAYMLARRLFVHYTQTGVTGDQPTDTAFGINIQGQGAPQLADEASLWSNFLTSRPAMDPIVAQYNFIPCAPNIGDDPCSLGNNLCASAIAATASPLGAAFPNGNLGTAAGTGGTKTIDSQGKVLNAAGTTLAQATCSTSGAGGYNQCVSDGSLCVTGTPCPLANNRPANAACSQNSDCASNVCGDYLGLGAPGALFSLVCQ
jgi:hypothetical protein